MSKPEGRPLVVGLTGGIGSGKTAVSRLFIGFGIEVIDADEISRDMVKPGSAALASIAGRFGPGILNADGSLKRDRLRGHIFNDAEARHWLEQLLHPLIRAAILERIKRSPSRWLLLSVPLLLENRAYDFVDRVLVVDVPENVQVDRTMRRDNSTREEVQRILASQLSRRERLAQADDVIDNSGSPADLQEAVARLKQRYEDLAS